MAAVRDEGVLLLWVTIPLLALSVLVVAARFGVRKWRKNLGLDDWLMCAGLVGASTLLLVCNSNH